MGQKKIENLSDFLEDPLYNQIAKIQRDIISDNKPQHEIYQAISLGMIEDEIMSETPIIPRELTEGREELIHFKYRDITDQKLPFSNDSMDLIVVGNYFEYVENPLEILGELWRILRNDGALLIMITNNHDSKETFSLMEAVEGELLHKDFINQSKFDLYTLQKSDFMLNFTCVIPSNVVLDVVVKNILDKFHLMHYGLYGKVDIFNLQKSTDNKSQKRVFTDLKELYKVDNNEKTGIDKMFPDRGKISSLKKKYNPDR